MPLVPTPNKRLFIQKAMVRLALAPMKLITLVSLSLLTFRLRCARAADLQQRIYTATQILEQKQGSLSAIPAEVLAHARGVAIGTITKAGLGIGGQGGEGIVAAALPGHDAPDLVGSGRL